MPPPFVDSRPSANRSVCTSTDALVPTLALPASWLSRAHHMSAPSRSMSARFAPCAGAPILSLPNTVCFRPGDPSFASARSLQNAEFRRKPVLSTGTLARRCHGTCGFSASRLLSVLFACALCLSADHHPPHHWPLSRMARCVRHRQLALEAMSFLVLESRSSTVPIRIL